MRILIVNIHSKNSRNIFLNGISLLIASDANPVEIIERTINYIMGGGIIVIFSSFIEVFFKINLISNF